MLSVDTFDRVISNLNCEESKEWLTSQREKLMKMRSEDWRPILRYSPLLMEYFKHDPFGDPNIKLFGSAEKFDVEDPISNFDDLIDHLVDNNIEKKISLRILCKFLETGMLKYINGHIMTNLEDLNDDEYNFDLELPEERNNFKEKFENIREKLIANGFDQLKAEKICHTIEREYQSVNLSLNEDNEVKAFVELEEKIKKLIEEKVPGIYNFISERKGSSDVEELLAEVIKTEDLYRVNTMNSTFRGITEVSPLFIIVSKFQFNFLKEEYEKIKTKE